MEEMAMRVQLKNLICTTDFSELSNRAIPYGISLANAFGAKLYVCHVIGLPSTAIYGEILVDPTEQHNKAQALAQAQLENIIGEQAIEWQPLISIGHIADEINHLAEEMRADLVITATHGRSGLRRLILGSVSGRLVRTLPCPVLIIPGHEQDVRPVEIQGFKFQRILVGCDFSTVSSLALQYGLSMAQEFQSELHLAHVIEPPAYRNFNRSKTKNGEDFEPDLRDYLNGKLKKMVPEDAQNWCTPMTTLLEGKSDEELTDYAVSQKIDLIVLGVRGQGLVEKLFVGSTTERVIGRAACPVLSVCARVQDTQIE
jgi:nucleotide-binding universal stress UspA family protein